MRVLEVVPYYAPAWAYGGPPKVMWEEAKILAARGHDVEVFTTDAFDADGRVRGASRAVEDGVVVRRFPNVSNWLAYHQYRFTPRGFVSALRTARPDVIHLSEMRHELAIGAWWLARTRRIPLVISAHGTLPVRTGIKAEIRKLYDRRWVLPMIKGAAALLAQTQHEASLYEEYGAARENVHLLPLGVDPPPDAGSTAGGEVDLGVPDGARVVLFLGRISPLKGVLRLIDAFAQIASDHPDVHLVIAGRDDGALADAVELARSRGLSDRVQFPGAIYGDLRFAAYRRADLFAITPTHFEETSLASLEAASVGTPVLTSAEADLPLLGDYDAGFRVPEGGDVAPVLDRALRENLDPYGQAAQRMVEAEHLWPVVVTRLEQILEQMR